MKFWDEELKDWVAMSWKDHAPWCARCREEVDIKRPATYAHACVLGSQLINEWMRKEADVEAKLTAKKVREWAKRAGTFINEKTKTPRTRYVETKETPADPPAEEKK